MTALPSMSTPLVVAGTWLQPSQPDGVVVEASFAAAAHVGLGDEISVQSVDANVVRMKIVGIADTADQGFYPQWTPGVVRVFPPKPPQGGPPSPWRGRVRRAPL